MAIRDDERFQAMEARWADLLPLLNERDRRLALATEAKSWGRGGASAVHDATGALRTTIRRGLAELADSPAERSSGRVRAPGGGRKKAEVVDPELLDSLDLGLKRSARHRLDLGRGLVSWPAASGTPWPASKARCEPSRGSQVKPGSRPPLRPSADRRHEMAL